MSMDIVNGQILDLIQAFLQKSANWASDNYADSIDSNGDAVLTVSQDSSPAAGERVAVIRCKKDDLGASGAAAFTGAANLVIPQYRPNVIEIAIEAASGGPISRAQLAELMAAADHMGTKVRLYEETSGTVPTTASMIPSKLILSERGNQFIPGISQ